MNIIFYFKEIENRIDFFANEESYENKWARVKKGIISPFFLF